MGGLRLVGPSSHCGVFFCGGEFWGGEAGRLPARESRPLAGEGSGAPDRAPYADDGGGRGTCCGSRRVSPAQAFFAADVSNGLKQSSGSHRRSNTYPARHSTVTLHIKLANGGTGSPGRYRQPVHGRSLLWRTWSARSSPTRMPSA